MARRGKSINIFLMDGDPNGRIKCTLTNWTGVAYKIPRTELERCKDLPALKQSGVYFLFGTSDDNGEAIVYVGQAGVRKNGEGILMRLQEHKRDTLMDYWTEAVVFTTSNNSFGPTEISYLENRFCNLAIEAERYVVKNANDPSSGNVTEEKESELEEFIDYAKIVIGTLGYKAFERLVTTEIQMSADEESSTNSDVVFELKQGKCAVKGQRTSEGFVLFKGGKIRDSMAQSCPKHAKAAREKHANSIDKDGFILNDILLRSPAEAACFATGISINARNAWKTSDGKTLKDIETAESVV